MTKNVILLIWFLNASSWFYLVSVLLFSSNVLIFIVWSVKSLKDGLQLETAEQLLQDLDDYLETMEIFVS